jgi:hypothetical protein
MSNRDARRDARRDPRSWGHRTISPRPLSERVTVAAMDHRGAAAPGLARLVIRRMRADAPRLLAAWLVLLAAISLIATGVQYADDVTTVSLRSALLDAPGTARGVSVDIAATPANVVALDAAVRPVVASAVGTTATVALISRSSSLVPILAGGSPRSLVVLGGYEGLEAHARLTAGRWPVSGQTPLEATLSDGAAAALGLRLGEIVPLADAATPGAGATPVVSVVITGTWSADPADPYWLGDRLDLDGSAPLNGATYAGPLMVSPEDLQGRQLVPGLALTWRAGIAVDQLVPEQVHDLERGVTALPDAVASVLPAGVSSRVDASLADLLGRVAASLELARGGVALLLVQFAVLAAYAVIQLSALLAERRQRQDRLLEVRGATGRSILIIGVLEAILLVAPAVVVAPLVAAAAVAAMAAVGPLRDAGVSLPINVTATGAVAAVAAGLVAAAILAAPALPFGERAAAVRLSLGRGAARFRGRRVALDAGLLLIAGLAIWQLRVLAAPTVTSSTGGAAGPSATGVHPALAVGPGVAMLAVAMVATRALPRLAGLAERWTAKDGRIGLRLAVVELARRPQRATQTTLLVILAVGLASFALTQSATWYGSQADQAAYQAAASLRAVTPAYATLPDDRLGPAYRAVPGVTTAIPAVRSQVTIGGAVRTADLLAVDGTAAATLGSLPGGPTGRLASALAGLGADRPAVAATSIPSGARTLIVTLDTALTGNALGFADRPGFVVDPTLPVVRAAALILDADGLLWRYESTNEAAYAGAGQRLVIPLATLTAGGQVSGPGHAVAPGPLRLEALDIVVDEQDWSVVVDGAVDVRSVATTAAGGSDAATAPATELAFDPTGPGWQWLRSDASSSVEYSPPTGQPNRLLAGTKGWRTISGSFPASPTTWRAWAVPTRANAGADATGDIAVDAIVSESLLAATGQSPGDVFNGSLSGASLLFHIASGTPAMPPLDPGRPFVVVDGPTLALAELVAGGSAPAPSEWWLTTDPPVGASVAARVADAPFGASVVARASVQQALEADPVALAVVGALALGALASLLLALASFGTALSATFDARLGELGLIRALGVSDAQMRRGMVSEQAIVLVAGTAIGMVLGTATAWLVLPVSMLTNDGSRPVPDPVLVLPAAALVAIAASGLLLLLAAAVLVARRLHAIDTAATLRGEAE